jgi:hypothetical protein
MNEMCLCYECENVLLTGTGFSLVKRGNHLGIETTMNISDTDKISAMDFFHSVIEVCFGINEGDLSYSRMIDTVLSLRELEVLLDIEDEEVKAEIIRKSFIVAGSALFSCYTNRADVKIVA